MDVKVSDSRFVRAQDNADPPAVPRHQPGAPAYVGNAIKPQPALPAIATRIYQLARGPGSIREPKTRSASTLSTRFRKARFQVRFDTGSIRRTDSRQRHTALNLHVLEGLTRGPLDNSPTAPRGSAGIHVFASPLAALSPSAATDYAMESKVSPGYFQNDWGHPQTEFELGSSLRVETAITERYKTGVWPAFDPNASQPFRTAVGANYARNPTPEIPSSQFSVKGGRLHRL